MGNYDNLAIHIRYYDDSIKSHEESLLRLNEIVFDISKIWTNLCSFEDFNDLLKLSGFGAINQ
jgi:hypothetical protein